MSNSNPNDTQAIFREMSEIKSMMSNHITKTEVYREQKDIVDAQRNKVVDAHSDAIWDKDGKPGIATRLDRLEQSEATRKWTLRAIVVALLGTNADKIFHIFK